MRLAMFTGSSQTSDHLVSLLQFRGLPLNTGIMVGCTWYKSFKKKSWRTGHTVASCH